MTKSQKYYEDSQEKTPDTDRALIAQLAPPANISIGSDADIKD